MNTMYKDITLLNKWKEHGDNRFLFRLKALERIEANDTEEEYYRLQYRMDETFELIRQLAQIIQDNDIEVSENLRFRMEDPDFPF